MTGKKKKAGAALTRSPFLTALRDQFFDAETDAPKWPTADSDEGRARQAARQMPEALKAMIHAVNSRKPPRGKTKEGSALARVKEAAKAAHWPGTSKSAPTFAGNKEMFRYFEVGCAIDIMMEAWFRSGGHGGGEGWPNGGGGKH